MKKLLIFFCMACLLLSVSACTKMAQNDEITLSDEDQQLLDTLGEDVNVVTDETFAEVVEGFESNPSAYSGQIFQLEGVIAYSEVESQTMGYLYRTHVHDDHAHDVGVLLRYLPQNPDEGDWIRVTGILTVEEHEGHEHVYFDVITLETPSEHGEATLH